MNQRQWISALFCIISCLLLFSSPAWAISGPELLKQGSKELKLLQTEKALETFVKALDAGGLNDVQRAEAETYRGLAFLIIGKSDSAKEAFKRAVKADINFRPDMKLFSPWAASIYEEVRQSEIKKARTAPAKTETAAKKFAKPKTEPKPKPKKKQKVAVLKKTTKPPKPAGPTHEECRRYADDGFASARQGDYDKALELLNRSILCGKLEDKELAVVYRAAGKIRLNQKLLDKARQLLERSVALNPKDADTHNSLGAVWANKGDRKKAVEYYTRAIELKPDFSLAIKNRGAQWRSLGNHDRAMADFNRAIQVNPGDHQAYNERGIVWEKLGKFDKAIADFSKTIELNPGYTPAYYNRGLQYAKTRSFDRSLADFNKTIQMAPNFAQAYWSRSFIYEVKRQFSNAIADMETFMRKNPNNSAGSKRLSKLRARR